MQQVSLLSIPKIADSFNHQFVIYIFATREMLLALKNALWYSEELAVKKKKKAEQKNNNKIMMRN